MTVVGSATNDSLAHDWYTEMARSLPDIDAIGDSSPSDTPSAAAPPTRVKHWVISITLSVAVSLVAIAIGEHTIRIGPAAVVLFPIIWAVLLGAVVGLQRLKPVTGAVRAVGDPQVRIGIVLFLALLGMGIGPNLGRITNLGPAIVLQEVGHIFGTVIIALPIAVGLRMGRAAIGATWSVDRESYLAFAIERFGTRAPEYRGVFGVWIFGSLFGALYISLVAGLLGSLGIFSPLALAMGLGLGSSSMMLGGVGALSVLYPDRAGEILAVAGLSNLLTNIVGFYAGVFLSLPLARRLYLFWTRVWRRPAAEIDEAVLVARGQIPAGDASRDGGAVARLVAGRDGAGSDASASDDSRARGSDRTLTTAEAAAELGVAVDPPEPRGWRVSLFVYLSAGVIGLLLNWVGTGEFAPIQLLGTLLLLLLTALSFRLAAWVPAVPASVWVLGIATILSAPVTPLASVFTGMVHGIDVMLFGLLQLALIGMSLGRDVGAIKQLSWRVVVVALLTLTGSFVAAAALAQTVLHL